MAREEFLLNLRTAAKSLSPEVHVNGIRLDPTHIDNVIARADLWLTPRAVEGFEPGDFPELKKDERLRLNNAVTTFRDVASQVPGDRPATRAQVDKARPAFRVVLDAMLPYLGGFRIYWELKKSNFPDYVRDFAVRVGEDSTGDPAAWVWVIIDDQLAGSEFYERVPELRDRIRQVFLRSKIELYPYISVRTESEQQELEASEAR